MSQIRALKLDVTNGGGFSEVMLGDHWKQIVQELGCEYLTVTQGMIGGEVYDIYCDDEGLFVDSPIPSALDREMQPALVGNLIFARHTQGGDTAPLSDEDIENIKAHSVNVSDSIHIWQVVCID